MGYLNSDSIVVDAILTKHGRRQLATGQGLNVSKFALSDDGDVIINALPICHIFSLVAVCFSGFVNGCENVLITNPKDLKTFIGVLRKFQFASFAGVNTLFKKLI